MLMLSLVVGLTACHVATGDSLQIGANAAGEEAVIGYVGAVALVRDANRVLVLDTRLNRLLVFDCKGQLTQTIGRPGAGPGEFVVPTRLRVADDGSLHVLDRGLSRISVFSPSTEGYSFSKSVSLPVSVLDFCILPGTDRYLAYTAGRSAVVHELSTDGRLLRSFGSPDSTYATTLATRQLGRALIQCVDDATVAVPCTAIRSR